MASLKNTQEALFVTYCEDMIDDDEYLILNELNASQNLDIPYNSYEQLDVDSIDEADCIAEFRFVWIT